MSAMLIRPATQADAEGIWQIISPVIATGDTYAFDPATPREEMLGFWMGPGRHTYVAELYGEVVGTYFVKANQPGLGNHVANGGYMVHPGHHGKGIGKQLCRHSLIETKRLGFDALQFNFVIKSNEGAVQLWKKMGFTVIGEIPDAFRHKTLGLTPALIMYRKL